MVRQMNITHTCHLEDTGFYKGYNKSISLSVKGIIVLLIFWATASDQSAVVLGEIQAVTISLFGAWYVWVTAGFMLLCLVLACWPRTGKILLGKPGERPEFSNFAWFSMMFGAGIGVGMLTYSTAEPIFHLGTNPDVIMGTTDSLAANNVRSAYKWTLLHYGLTPWGCYGIAGMSLAYFSYHRDLPLTIRSPLSPLFGNRMSRTAGNLVDAATILATVIGVGVTIGYGVTQFAFGIHLISGAQWIMTAEGKPTTTALVLSVVLIMCASTLSASSGVGRGIKWLSNINMVLSFLLLICFLIFGARVLALESFFYGIYDYVLALPSMSTTVWTSSDSSSGQALSQWQGDWTIFYWAWWIAFTPFVGLFLSRVSRGRTIREYVIGAMIFPSLMCFTWFCIVGGTAIELEVSGLANGAIVSADLSAQLFTTISLLLDPEWARVLSGLCVLLLLTYLITSADSAVLVINTIAAGGEQRFHSNKHIAIWGTIVAGIIIALLVAGGLGALRSVMIIGALPFSLVMLLMAAALVKALWMDKSESAVSIPTAS
jgi:choline/carnitine/betaine transport